MNDALHIPAREVPVPASVSPEAQAMLARGPLGSMPEWPPVDDAAAWRRTVGEMNDAAVRMFAALAGSSPDPSPAPDLDEQSISGVPVYVSTPAAVARERRATVLNIHGGAWVQGGGVLCRAATPARASVFGARTWSLDYRMPPDHPFPAAQDDAVEVYRALLQERSPSEIVVAGDSAGANIAAGLMFRLREEELPLPAGLVLDTPVTDLTGSGDSLNTNAGIDTVLVGELAPTMAIYAGKTDLRHPHLSPLFGDFAAGFPPTLLLTGTRDRLLSDTVRLHRALLAAAVPVELHVFEAQGHGGFMGMAPEDAERAAVVTRFVAERLGER